MATTVLHKPKTKTIDWINPHLEYTVTLEVSFDFIQKRLIFAKKII